MTRGSFLLLYFFTQRNLDSLFNLKCQSKDFCLIAKLAKIFFYFYFWYFSLQNVCYANHCSQIRFEIKIKLKLEMIVIELH